MEMIAITLELSPERAAALLRLCDKLDFGDARRPLYPHVSAAIREEQAYEIMRAAAQVQKALEEAGVSAWPWIETGSAS